LRADLPIIVYALGSPNFIPGEYHGALNLAKKIREGVLGDVQMIVRPHPLFDYGELDKLFSEFRPKVMYRILVYLKISKRNVFKTGSR